MTGGRSHARAQFQLTGLEAAVQGGRSVTSVSAQPKVSGVFQCSC